MTSKRIIYRPSEKMRDVWRNAPLSKFRVLEGAVRSSKSYTANDIALREIQTLPDCNVLISGYSISSVARNVMAEWKGMIDPDDRLNLFRTIRDDKDEYIIINWRGLKGKRFYIRGAGKDNDYKQIQGGTFGYWLSDETTRHCKNFVTMAISRLSPPYAKGIWTMNPDSPFHFVKTDFLDRPELYAPREDGSSLFKRWTFFLSDNPSLSQDFIESLKQTYTGVFYQRYVLSRWVAAEGAIYDFFDHSKHIIALPTAKPISHVVGVDYGTGNPTVFLLFGINPSATPRIWLEKEYYYDSKAQGKQKTDAEYSADLRRFLGNIVPSRIIIDPSAASFITQLGRDGVRNVVHAKNEVLDGIRTQARMLKSGQYAVCVGCPKTIEEYAGYVWDEKAQLSGIDQPLKQHDHTKDAERYVLYTLYGEDMTVQGTRSNLGF